jgi:hypothetical protein
VLSAPNVSLILIKSIMDRDTKPVGAIADGNGAAPTSSAALRLGLEVGARPESY